VSTSVGASVEVQPLENSKTRAMWRMEEPPEMESMTQGVAGFCERAVS
jgi:hypothetical protein